jgi:ribosomal protein L11 methyltransferase
MCLQALERTVKQGDKVVDVGTGSGVLSIAAAMLGAEKVKALDLDEVAVNSAKLNIKLNKVQDIVEVSQGNLLDGVSQGADVVVANILAEVILRFTDDVASVVKEGGHFIASGIIQQKKQEVRDAISAAGFEVEETIQMEDWVAIVARRKQ